MIDGLIATEGHVGGDGCTKNGMSQKKVTVHEGREEQSEGGKIWESIGRPQGCKVRRGRRAGANPRPKGGIG